jgi:hypothetical protein
MPDLKLAKSELTLIKKYCSKIDDVDLCTLACSLPQQVVGDRSAACDILQKDKEIDRWLACAMSADEWFFKADSIGEIASLEAEARSKKAGK